MTTRYVVPAAPAVEPPGEGGGGQQPRGYGNAIGRTPVTDVTGDNDVVTRPGRERACHDPGIAGFDSGCDIQRLETKKLVVDPGSVIRLTSQSDFRESGNFASLCRYGPSAFRGGAHIRPPLRTPESRPTLCRGVQPRPIKTHLHVRHAWGCTFNGVAV